MTSPQERRGRWTHFTRIRHRRAHGDDVAATAGGYPEREVEPIPFEVAPDDPLLLYLQVAPRPVAVRDLELDSPALAAIREAGTELVVPLVSQGELIGVLNLGARRSQRVYNTEDRRLLDNLAGHAATAIRVAQLVRRRAHEARNRARIDEELRVARAIQQRFLPREVPSPEGWSVTPLYRPAREVGGDFYDFIDLPGGRIGLAVGDVTDKGVPAAMVMATTHSILRAEAPRSVEPGQVLARVNDLLCAEMPHNMFVTCLYGVLDIGTGRFRFANAGHNLPCIRTADEVLEPRATGMPLGLMEAMTYDEQEIVLGPGSTLLLYSDGIVEAHNPARELFGFPRLRDVVGRGAPGDDLVSALLGELDDFTGPGWEQEDDITVVMVERAPRLAGLDGGDGWDELGAFDVASELGNERDAAARVAAAVAPLDLSDAALQRLTTAVAEATMNAIEHGNECRADAPVGIRVRASESEVAVQVVDLGGATELPDPEVPDIEAKLAGLQSPRGWGLFLIRSMVDDVLVSSDGQRRTVELRLHRATIGEG